MADEAAKGGYRGCTSGTNHSRTGYNLYPGITTRNKETRMKALFGVLIGFDVGAAIANFVVFALRHQWINLGSGLFCIAMSIAVVVIGRATLQIQAETRRVRAETAKLRQQTEERWRRLGVDEAILKVTRGRDQ